MGISKTYDTYLTCILLFFLQIVGQVQHCVCKSYSVIKWEPRWGQQIEKQNKEIKEWAITPKEIELPSIEDSSSCLQCSVLRLWNMSRVLPTLGKTKEAADQAFDQQNKALEDWQLSNREALQKDRLYNVGWRFLETFWAWKHSPHAKEGSIKEHGNCFPAFWLISSRKTYQSLICCSLLSKNKADLWLISMDRSRIVGTLLQSHINSVFSYELFVKCLANNCAIADLWFWLNFLCIRAGICCPA